MSRSVVCAALLLVATRAGNAQVDPSGPWRTWHSPHFRVHAHAHLADDARHLAGEAERAYALLAAELDPPRGTIDLVVADNVDFANGFATAFPSNRIVVYVTPPAGTTSLDYYDDPLRLLLVHELAHVFHLDRADGVWGIMQTVFGRAPFAFPNAYQPAWVKEGLATYYESRFTGAGRVHSGFHRQLLASALMGDVWPAPGDLSLVSPKWPTGFGPYAWGAEFFARQAAERGDSIVPGFMRRTSGKLWPLSVSGPFEAAGGQSVSAGWTALRGKAAPGPPPERRILARGLRLEPRPRVAPRGDRIAYTVSRGRSVERVEVRAVPAHTLVASEVVNGAPSLAWIGDTLVLAQLDLTSPVTIRRDVYALADGRLARLTSGARLDHPFDAGGRLGAVDLNTRASRLIVLEGDSLTEMPAPSATVWSRVVLSLDGRWTAGARHWEGRWDMVVWPTGRPAEMRALTDDAAVDEDPAWSPDGRLYFASDRAGLPQIYRASVETGETERVTDEPTGAGQPAPLGAGVLVYVTLLEDGFALVRGMEQVAPDIVTAADDGTVRGAESGLAVRETGYRPWPALRPHYWIPVGRDEGATGLFVTALTGGSDAIGRTRYGIRAGGNVTGAPFRPEFVFGMSHSRWRRWSLDLTVGQSWSGLLAQIASGGTVELAELERALDVGLTHAWRRWRSSFAVRASGGVEETRYHDLESGTELSRLVPAVAGGALAVRAAWVERPPLAISAENGVALSGVARHRWALNGLGTGDEVRGSLSGFVGLPLPGFAHWALAVQVSAGRSDGVAGGVFGVGGVSSDVLEVVPGVALGAGRRTFGLRGYPRASGFTRAVTGVAELRIPLFLLGKGVWGLPLLVDRVSVTMFAEVGTGWRAGDAVSLTELRDIGGELVMDLGIAYDVPLRARLGAAAPLADGLGVRRAHARFYLALGPAF